jgi:hypothetical protein
MVNEERAEEAAEKFKKQLREIMMALDWEDEFGDWDVEALHDDIEDAFDSAFAEALESEEVRN